MKHNQANQRAEQAAPMSELLDLRADLSDPLTRYRRGVTEMAGRLRTDPFSPDLDEALQHLYVTEVAPALLDTRDGFAEHSLVREVAKHLAVDIKPLVLALAGPVVGAGISQLGTLNGWVAAGASSVPAAAAAVTATGRALSERAQAHRELRRGELFYLYEVNRQLGS
jgi:hypothetical protein